MSAFATPGLNDADLYDQRDKLADVLKAHQPTTDQEKRAHRCACGLEFHFVDAKAWHRHAAAMVLGELVGTLAKRAT